MKSFAKQIMIVYLPHSVAQAIHVSIQGLVYTVTRLRMTFVTTTLNAFLDAVSMAAATTYLNVTLNAKPIKIVLVNQLKVNELTIHDSSSRI